MLPLYLGGDTTTISFTPATCAGTAVIMTVDGSGADAPGTHIPTRFIGVYLMPVDLKFLSLPTNIFD